MPISANVYAQPWLEQASFPASELSFELVALAKTLNYQKWLFETVTPFLGNRILEIGSGIGNMSQWLPIRDLLCLSEFDQALFNILSNRLNQVQKQDPRLQLRHLNILDHSSAEELSAMNFDSIVSFNVLEHIEDDSLAVAKQIEILKASKATGPKRLFILVPAHNWAHGGMDQKFEHYRRYSLPQLKALAKKHCPLAKITGNYMNTVGLAGWFLQGKILGKTEIGASSIEAFEKLSPLIKGLDKIFRAINLPLGQSVWISAEID